MGVQVKVSMVFFETQINFGRGVQTQVLDMSQPKHRLLVKSMDLDKATMTVTIVPDAACGLTAKNPGATLVFKCRGAVVDAEKPAKSKVEG